MPHTPRAQHGYSYLAVLFLVALTAAALASLGQAWSTAAQRERERELQFRGKAIAHAIKAYQKSSQNQALALPHSLDDLLEDRRGPVVRHHLRQRYADPFTGAADWELVHPPGDTHGFIAVRSRSSQALLRAFQDDGSPLERAKDWVFSALQVEAAAAPASAPTSSPGLGRLP